MLAAQDIRDKLVTVASRLMQADASELAIGGDKIYVRAAPDRHMPIKQVARAIYSGAFAPHMEGIEPGLS